MADNKDLIKEFLTGGWLVALIGAAGMIARLLTDDTKTTLRQQIQRILAAAICATIAWFILESTDFSSLTKAVIYGIIGVISPEILQGLTHLAKKFAKNPEKFLKKK
jgi:hypothetical protein